MLTFKPIFGFKPGTLSKIIHSSYANLIKKYPKHWKQEEKKWDESDKQAYEDPSIGKCSFVTCLDDIPIGTGSYDPRPWPKYGVIGQNCILPEYQGRGFGKQQIKEILRIFKENGVKRAKVTTSEHPFFVPAQKMYQSLGFKEVRKVAGGPDPNFRLIEYELEL